MLVALGESDCELIRSGLLAQPVNALTSLAFVAVGLAVASRRRRDRTGTAVAFAALLVAVGVGSLAFHGPQLPGAQMLHDTSIHLLLAFVALHRVHGRAVPWTALAAVGATSALVGTVAPGLASAITASLAVAAVLAEVRWHVLATRPGPERRAAALLVAVLAVAGITFVLGRTGAPTCDPHAVLQLHGLWHVSAAAAFGLWWWQLDPSSAGHQVHRADVDA